MKTIEVSDEMYTQLIELSKEMLSQDPRGTRMPHIFQIRTIEEVAAFPGCGEDIYVNENGIELRTLDEQREYIDKNYIPDKEGEEINEYEYDFILEEAGFTKMNVTTKHEYNNIFFTAKACDEHIRLNNYHYREPSCYLNHAWRNPEMELISTFLCELSGGKIYV